MSLCNYDLSLINIQDLIEKKNAIDSDLLIIQDQDDTKKIALQDLVLSIIKDNELPGEARLYSSKKINELIEEIKNGSLKDLTGLVADLERLEEEKVGHTEFQEKLNEVDNRKLERDDLDPIYSALETKRNIQDPIKGTELDISDDRYKIKLANLAQEVLDAMTGDTPVTAVGCPEGGWQSRHIANRAIISTKLHDFYRYKGFITDMSVNSIITDGVYLLGPEVQDLPKYDKDDDNLRLLEVTRFGENGKYVKQVIEYFNNADLRPKYVRKGVASVLYTVDFAEEWDISSNYKVDSHLLGDEYSNRGVIESGNIFDIEVVGSYYIMKGVTGTPDTSKAYTLDVSKYNNTTSYLLKETTKDYCLMWVSEKFISSNGLPNVTPWHSINKLNKSKFDGKRLLIFGDGISYGIGASALSTTSYAGLLKSEYGFVVQNNALGDATAGNYGDITCQNKSLLTQINSTKIDDTCDYAIIFIGTNDWRYAKGDIGKNNDFGDLTFYGAMNMAMVNLLEKAPLMKILLVTPMYRERQDYGDNKNSDDYAVNYIYLREYCDAVKRIGEMYHVPVLDLYNMAGINKYNSSLYFADGLHPNDTGHKLIADQIYNIMNLYM